MTDAYYAAAIKYERPFEPKDLVKRSWKIQDAQGDYITAMVPCFSGKSLEELFYCQDHFLDAMETLGKKDKEHLDEWKTTLHGTPKILWQEVMDEGNPETRKKFPSTGAGFLRAFEHFILHYCPNQDAKNMQL